MVNLRPALDTPQVPEAHTPEVPPLTPPAAWGNPNEQPPGMPAKPASTPGYPLPKAVLVNSTEQEEPWMVDSQGRPLATIDGEVIGGAMEGWVGV